MQYVVYFVQLLSLGSMSIFLLLNSIPLFGHTTIIHSSVDWYLWFHKYHNSFDYYGESYAHCCTSRDKHRLSFLLDKYLGMEVLGFIISKCLTLKDSVLQSGFIILYSLHQWMGFPVTPSPLKHWYYQSFKFYPFWWGYAFLLEKKRNEKCLLNEWRQTFLDLCS